MELLDITPMAMMVVIEIIRIRSFIIIIRFTINSQEQLMIVLMHVEASHFRYYFNTNRMGSLNGPPPGLSKVVLRHRKRSSPPLACHKLFYNFPSGRMSPSRAPFTHSPDLTIDPKGVAFHTARVSNGNVPCKIWLYALHSRTRSSPLGLLISIHLFNSHPCYGPSSSIQPKKTDN